MRALIVDDEPLARSRLRALLNAEPDVVIAGEARDGVEALAAVRTSRVDVVFLDIQMPNLDGFGFVDSLPGGDVPHIIFVTAYNEHAARAFDVNALDYLVKPFENARFQHAMQKLRRTQADADAGAFHERFSVARAELGRFAHRLAVPHGAGYELVDVADIDWISSFGNYVRLHTRNGARMLRSTMKKLQERLDPEQFLRIHRSTIVNVSRIRGVRPWHATEFMLTLHDGTELPSSRRYRRDVAALLRQDVGHLRARELPRDS